MLFARNDETPLLCLVKKRRRPRNQADILYFSYELLFLLFKFFCFCVFYDHDDDEDWMMLLVVLFFFFSVPFQGKWSFLSGSAAPIVTL